ncbi:MAG: phosphoadenosine phosphosulfate reductase [Planctomycetes bacterium]|nr:phosphoadenosine phosphosulfate reductase [Planctomycetota bacterium]
MVSTRIHAPRREEPLVVAYGLGVDLTAMLVEFARRKIRPDLILFADTGGEKPETYQYLDVIQPYLRDVGFPPVIVVRYQPKWAVYDTLEDQCLHTGTLPSLAYGGKSCSIKYKRHPQDKYVSTWEPAQRCWAAGGKVLKAIGFDAGPADMRRHRYVEDDRFRYWYPLVDWGHDRPRCQQIIEQAGLPVPMKSACFYCPASKKPEIVWLQEHHPDLLERALQIERNAQEGLLTIKGLGRSYSWEGFLKRRDEFPLLDGCSG